MRSDELLITLLHAAWQGRDLCISDSSMSGASDASRFQIVLSLPFVGHQAMRRCIYEWKVTRRTVGWKGLPADVPDHALCQQIVGRILAAGAFEELAERRTAYVMLNAQAGELACLQALQKHGWVARAEDKNEFKSRVITRVGVAHLSLFHKVDKPVSCFR